MDDSPSAYSDILNASMTETSTMQPGSTTRENWSPNARSKSNGEFYIKARKGSILFCIMHALFEVLIINSLSAFTLVFINYFFSVGIITVFEPKLKEEVHPYVAGFLASSLVFICRVIIAALIDL